MKRIKIDIEKRDFLRYKLLENMFYAQNNLRAV
jgi:hypothetical protein